MLTSEFDIIDNGTAIHNIPNVKQEQKILRSFSRFILIIHLSCNTVKPLLVFNQIHTSLQLRTRHRTGKNSKSAK